MGPPAPAAGHAGMSTVARRESQRVAGTPARPT
jgi:hypothetical protein